MKRYVINRAFAQIDAQPDAEDYLARTVYEPDPSPVDTGLLDAQGNRLYAVTEMDRIGFVRWPYQSQQES